MQTPVLVALMQRRDRGEDRGYFGSRRVIDVNICEGDGATRVDDEHGGEGDATSGVCVRVGDIEPELGVCGACLGARLGEDAELAYESVRRVGEDVELERTVGGGGLRALRSLRANRDQGDASLGECRQQMMLVVLKGEVAIGAPCAPIVDQNSGGFADLVVEVHLAAVRVEESGVRHRGANRDCVGGNARRSKVRLLLGEDRGEPRADLLGESGVEWGARPRSPP